MALLGQAALAMWWDMAADRLADFQHWHSHEHFPERLGVPGFLRASRWRASDGGEGFFVLYELRSHDVLSSPAYVARLNAPSPWSARLMPHHRNMVRSQCRVLATSGSALASHCFTVRMPPDGAPLAGEAASRPGITGVHFLQHESPPVAQTTEQTIRPAADQSAERVLVVSGYDEAALRELAREAQGGIVGHYRLAHSALAGEL